MAEWPLAYFVTGKERWNSFCISLLFTGEVAVIAETDALFR